MRNRAFPKAVLLGLMTFALLPGRGDASGRGADLVGTLASGAAVRAEAVSGPIIDISPASHDFGRVNVGASGGSFDFTVTNSGDADLHITGVIETSPGKGFSFSSAVVPGTIGPGGTGLITISWIATGSGRVADNFLIESDAVNGLFPILVQGYANNAPEFTPPLLPMYFADAFVPFSLTASAIDSEGDVIEWSLSSLPPLPAETSFDPASGALALTPLPGDAGDYAVTIEVSDGMLTTPGNFTLRIRALNNQPVAVPGGPYRGFTGIPLQFDGSASNDPDAGQTLTYEWDFGDGTGGTGPSPVHTYARPSVYLVSLTVTDSDILHLQDTETTAATIKDFIEATIVQSPANAGVVRTTGKGTQRFGIQMFLRPVTDIDPGTIRVSTTYPNAGTVSEIGIVEDRHLRLGDLNGDLFVDLDCYFRTTDIRALLQHVPNGQTVTLLFTGTLTPDAVPFRGTVDVVKQGTSSVALTAAPNPFNPETTIHYSVEGSGTVSIRIFSVDGRLVRSLSEGPSDPGTHEVRWNGKDDGGRPVPSGLYFVKVEQGGSSSVSKLSLLK